MSTRCQPRTHPPVLVHMRIFAVGVICGLLLLLPGAASAAVCAPPGNSGVSQYVEVVPGAGCNHRTGGGSGSQGGSLPPGAASQLRSQGGAGAAVAQLVHATGTAPRSSTRHGAGAGVNVPASPGRSLLPALLHPVVSGSGGGLGVLLPVILGAALMAALAAALLRRRRMRLEP